MNKLVSVVIATHNRPANILKQAIDSVLNQTYPYVELIVVNDAPNYDRRTEIDSLIESYGNRVTYIINEKGGGANVSRNIGASVAKGTYLSFLDDDDYWDLDRLNEVVKELESGFDVVYHDIIIFSSDEKRRIYRYPIHEEKMLERILYSNDWGGFSSVTMRKNKFDEAGRLDPSAKSQQDTDLWIRLAQICKVSYINKPLTFYRDSPDSISANEQKKLDGLYQLFNKYDSLYNKFPKSKYQKMQDELVLFVKNGWKKGAKKLFHDLAKENMIAAIGAYLKGLCKSFYIVTIRKGRV